MGNISIDQCRTDRRTFLKHAGAGLTACAAYSHFNMQSFAQNASAGAVVETTAGKVRGLGGRMGAPHTVEIPFVFDNTDIPKVMTTGRPEEKALAAKTSEAWIQFARSGNPNHKGLPNWPAYTNGERATMVFDNACKLVNDPGSEERKLWASL